MTVMVDREIDQAVTNGRIGIYPFNPDMVQPNSLDIRLGNHFVWYQTGSEYDDILDIRNPETLSSRTRELTVDAFVLYPREFILARSLELVTIPNDVLAILEGKSSLARLGITIHQTGGVIDSGFCGTITLEISNVNCRPVKLYAGMPIAQLIFHDIGAFVDKPYSGKYQDQFDATLSRY